jgi:phosphoribosylamine--glycine ligase
MIVDGEPYLLEYNIRMGDPEAQAVLPRVTSNLVTTFMQAAAGEQMDPVEFSSKCTIATVLASEGYPTNPKDGFVLEGIEAARKVPGTDIFFGGVDLDEGSRLITKGGRVLSVVTQGDNPAEVKTRNNKAVELITFTGAFHRPDIGNELLELG